MKRTDVVIATGNEKKRREIRRILNNAGVRLVSLNAYPGAPTVVEDGRDFRENALKKAVTIARFTGKVTVADDSGLEVKALDGKPGIYSARFAGKNGDDRANIAKLLRLLKGVPKKERKARFVCCIAVALPDGRAKTVTGTCSGTIIEETRGTRGFGYDPVFVPRGYRKTFAELSTEVKNRISHRANALKKARHPILQAADRFLSRE